MRSVVIAVALAAFSLSITLSAIGHEVAFNHWLAAIFAPDDNDLSQVIVHYSLLPRAAVSLLAGAGLGLSGAVFQQVLRNPLAEPTTLGVSAGAHLALILASLFVPTASSFGMETVAIGGAMAAAALMIFLSWKGKLSPATMIMSGLMISLYAGSLGSVLGQFFGEDLGSVFIWSTGSLSQNDWTVVEYLLPRLSVSAVLIGLLVRPMVIVGLEDDNARSLGLPLKTMRLLTLSPAIALSAFVVSSVGIIGFIGLAAPVIARLSGARRYSSQLTWAPILGGLLLWSTDEVVQLLGKLGWSMPTGAATATLGAPLLLWLLPRMPPEQSTISQTRVDVPRSKAPIAFIVIISIVALNVSLTISSGSGGWQSELYFRFWEFLDLRAPRVFSALAAGAVLSMAGAILQRFTGNAMASPEILGISSGASLAALFLLLLIPMPSGGLMLLVASGGAFLTMAAMLAFAHRSAFSPQRVLLTGISLGISVNAATAMLTSSNSASLRSALSWLSGSTYQADSGQAIFIMVVLLAGVAFCSAATRWLEILPLGHSISEAVGVDLPRSRMTLLVLSAVLTASATLIVGPLSFVGLMAPHMARAMGMRRPMPHLFGSTVLGALIMIVADWLGRNLFFPFQVPAGLLATFVGGPYFFWLLRRGTG